jgi:hypothetical protein
LSLLPSNLTIRTNRTSFQYSRSNPDGGTSFGRVKAVADGALILKTNKAKDEGKYCIWSKQRCAISFEVKHHINSLTVGQKGKSRLVGSRRKVRFGTNYGHRRSKSRTNSCRDVGNGMPSGVHHWAIKSDGMWQYFRNLHIR